MSKRVLGVLLGVVCAMSACAVDDESETSSELTVSLLSIAVTPPTPSTYIGGQVPMKATGFYSDATTKDLTSTVTWASSNATIAPIGPDGVATALKQGSVTISAKSGTRTGST